MSLPYKLVFIALALVGYGIAAQYFFQDKEVERTEASLKQLEDNGAQGASMKRESLIYNQGYILGYFGVVGLCLLSLVGEFKKMFKKMATLSLLFIVICSSGCYRPFEPVKLEVISPNEEAFLLPYVGDSKKQTSSNNEEYLTQNLVFTKQVQIPQQWHPTGRRREDGTWEDAAILVKVDKSPVTREWTADANSGTSSKNEAIWVMTSDQVEFSTGWACTARISSRDAAVKFLHNYPNGSLQKVLDTEVRSHLATTFGLEVTDLPMDTLRKAATPHIKNTVKQVTEFFATRGITITNLGITGGFVYKDKSIVDTMIKVFNAEQEKAVAQAETAAQEERNKKVVFTAQGQADAILKTKKAEADGIKLVADAKFYELEKAKENLKSYVQLKELELQKELLLKWDGRYPQYFMGGNGQTPNMLLQLPKLDEKK